MTHALQNVIKTNILMLVRNRSSFFWMIVIPLITYIALSFVPLERYVQLPGAYSDFLLPGIIAMVTMQGGIYGLAYWMVDLKARGVIKRLIVTPVSKAELLLGVMASRIFVVFIQAVLLTLIGVLIFGTGFAGNIISTAVLIILGGAVFLSLGLLIATLADTYEAAAPLTAAFGLPSLIGGIFFPVTSLPQGLSQVAQYLPITFLADGLRLVYTQPFNAVWQSVLIDELWLLGWFCLIFAIVYKRLKFLD